MSQSEPFFSLLTNKNKSTVKETHTQDSFFLLSYTIEETGSLFLFLFLYSMKAYYIIRRAKEEEEKKRAMKIVSLSLSLSRALEIQSEA